MRKGIFRESYFQWLTANIEFRYFKELAQPEIDNICNGLENFGPLKDGYSFYIDNKREDALQLWFGNRETFRKNDKGEIVSEGGIALLYTLGPTGYVAVAIYPAKSEVARPIEDHIYLRIGLYSGHQLRKKSIHPTRTALREGKVPVKLRS